MQRESPALVVRPGLLAAGFTDEELRRWRAQGRLVTVRPGVYIQAARPDDPAARHGLAIRAAVQQIAPGAVMSHVSAAVLHGLPLWSAPLDRVHVTRNRRSGGRRSRFLHLHAAALEPDEIVLVDGIAVTSVARTIADLTRHLPFEPAVVSADAALHRGLVTRAALADAVERSSNRRGNTAARRVVAFADGRSESPGESRSRVALQRAGLPAPVPQYVVRSASGTTIARVDFGWPKLRTVGEFDGLVKYGRLLQPGQVPAEVVVAEKRREDAIRDEDLRVRRWGWDDLDNFEPVARRLRLAFDAG
ncbi:type IV toxin-antitoxin system AbiEi family antitoxin domain-containing protein [Pseudonocardia xinjiangensis]|uniref:type IV toxin-antitoxin system AbiEi family antitoxin domain-containing protein n=1 Tax=Pseudonocardia xinjiangensis TaxID=75289 RepID=UPI003D8D051B